MTEMITIKNIITFDQIFVKGDDREKYSYDKKLKVIRMYLEGIGIRSIERLENVSAPLILKWIKGISKIIKNKLHTVAESINEENFKKLLDEISNPNPFGEEITLVGATKMVSADEINKAIDLGLKVVAENKVQEFRDKTDLIDKRAEQHFIGHLQTNKVKYLIGKVSLIHSVDSEHLAEVIDKESAKKVEEVTKTIL